MRSNSVVFQKRQDLPEYAADIPWFRKELTAATLEGDRIPLNRLWNRRQCTKFNGTSYITQRAAEAVYSAEGKIQIKETIDYYMTNAQIMKEGLEAAGLKVYGGVNAPYLWVKTPNGLSSLAILRTDVV